MTPRLLLLASTYCMQVGAVLVGAACVWMACLAFNEGRYLYASIDAYLAAVNAILFCSEPRLRAYLRGPK
jgi:ammonia channel protein AmtB